MRLNAKRSRSSGPSYADVLLWTFVIGAAGLLIWVFIRSLRRDPKAPGPAAGWFSTSNSPANRTQQFLTRLPPVPVPRSLLDVPPPARPESLDATGRVASLSLSNQPALTPTNRSLPGLVLTNRTPPALSLTNRSAQLSLPPPPDQPSATVRPVANLFEAQVALASLGISPGSIDGQPGSQSRAALRAFQLREGLPASGDLTPATMARLQVAEPLLTQRVITSLDVARLRPLSSTWLGKSQQDRLDFETILELLSEESRTHPDYVRRLNPEVDWRRVRAGDTIRLPRVTGPDATGRAARIRIHLAARSLQAFDADGRLIVHFPCSIARQVDKRPVGRLTVTLVIPNPNYTFNPAIFPESAEARTIGRKLVLPPGPNNPVGVAWIGLSRSGYGIHGTPSPEQVGRTESHGCFRLANWNARLLLDLITPGTPVEVEP